MKLATLILTALISAAAFSCGGEQQGPVAETEDEIGPIIILWCDGIFSLNDCKNKPMGSECTFPDGTKGTCYSEGPMLQPLVFDCNICKPKPKPPVLIAGTDVADDTTTVSTDADTGENTGTNEQGN